MNINFLRAEINIVKWKRAEKDYRMPFNIHFYFQITVAPDFNKHFYLVFPKSFSILKIEQQMNKIFNYLKSNKMGINWIFSLKSMQ